MEVVAHEDPAGAKVLHEARIIEAFFADLLDELFGPIP